MRSFKGVSSFVLQFCCSMNLIAATRAEGGLVSLSITIDLLKRVFTWFDYSQMISNYWSSSVAASSAWRGPRRSWTCTMLAEQMFQTGSPAGMLSQVSSRSFLTGGDSIILDIWNLRKNSCRNYLPLPGYDKHGRQVILMRPGKMDPTQTNLEEALSVRPVPTPL